MKKILITGASGFWGNNLIKYICDKHSSEYLLTCIYNSSNNLCTSDNIITKKCNLENVTEVNNLYDNFDIIVHLASIIKHTNDNFDKNYLANVNSSLNILNLAKNISISEEKKIKIVIASTIGTVACFNDKDQIANEKSNFSNKSKSFSYYFSKMKIEELAQDFNKNKNLDIVVIRPPVIYGVNDLKGRATHRIKKFLNSSVIFYTNGNIPFCDVKDLVKITFEIMTNSDYNECIYNIDGYKIGIKKFYEVLEEISGEKKYKIYIPYYFGKVMIPFLNYFINIPDIVEFEMGNSFWNSNSLFLKDFNWINYKRTLEDTINFIRNNYN